MTIYDASCFPSALVLERSLRELRQLQSLTAVRIVPVLAAGKWGDGAAYEATSTLPPQTLTETLAAGALSMADAAALVVQIGEALLEAQRVGVIHRSLGGDVIFPSPEGVRVTGFAVGEPQGSGSFGSLNAIAPEQVQGKVVDQRTLIYNVAALMHWMLSGTPLFAGDRAQILQQHNGADPPAEVHDKLKRALGKDPRMRPMMLKQFLTEVAVAGGVEPPKTATRVPPTVKPPVAKAPVATPSAGVAPPATEDGRKPSSRGWTMFMKAADEDAPASPSQPAPPAAAKPSRARAGGRCLCRRRTTGAAASRSRPSPSRRRNPHPQPRRRAKPSRARAGGPCSCRRRTTAVARSRSPPRRRSRSRNPRPRPPSLRRPPQPETRRSRARAAGPCS